MWGCKEGQPRSGGALVITSSVTSWRKVSKEAAGQRSSREWSIRVRYREGRGFSIIAGSRPRMTSIDTRETEEGRSSFLSGRVSKVASRFKVFPRSRKVVSVLTWL